jgi:hypothetical protein
VKLGTEDKKKLQLLGVVGVGALIAAFFLYSELFGGPSAPPSAPPVIATRTVAPPASRTGTEDASARVAGAGTATRVGTAGTALDPTLHMAAMERTESLVYSGSGRNIFASPDSTVAPPVLARAKFPARPLGPAVPVYNGPPPPPPIDLKFFGTVTAQSGLVRAFLLNGDNVFLAVPGDVVERRYRVVSIAANSISIEDLPNRNTQTLPLLATP